MQCRAELRHEVAHARIAACQGVGQEGAHERPAQACAKADRIVDFAGGGHPVVDQVQGLAPQRFEQTVGDKTRHFLAHVQRTHAQGFIHLDRRVYGLGCRVLAADDFNQWQQVNRVEWMADHAAFGVDGAFVKFAGQQAGSAGADQGIGLGCGADLAVQVQLQVQTLRGAFLDEVSITHTFFDGRDKAQTIL